MDREIVALVARFDSGPAADLVHEMIVAVYKFVREQAPRADLKLVARSLRELRYALRVFADYPDARKVTMFGSARTVPGHPCYEMARDFAAAMVERGWMVITGAGPGVMEAGNEGAGDRGFGLHIRLPFEGDANPFIAHDRKLMHFRYFFTRKLMFVKEASALVLLPGGYGTLDELFEFLTLAQTGKSDLHPVVFLEPPGMGYWAGLQTFLRDHALHHGLVSAEDLDLVRTADSVEMAVEEVERFYRNYHSERYVRGRLVLRLRRAPDEGELDALRADFADVIGPGGMDVIEPLPEEVADDDHLALERLAVDFTRRSFGRLRHLIDALNRLALHDREVPPGLDRDVRASVAITDPTTEEAADELDE